MTLADYIRPLAPRPRTSAIREYRYSRADYDALVEAGLFEGTRVELIRGRLIEMPAISDEHGESSLRGGRVLRQIFPEDAFTVRPALPFVAADDSKPEPDLCVVAGSVEQNARAPSTCLLLVEISLATLAYDRKEKASLYAESGVGEYWIVNLVDRVIERHLWPTRRDDGSWGYASITTHAEGTSCPIEAASGTALDVAVLLPARADG